MAEQRRTRPVARFVSRGLSAVACAAMAGSTGCSSGSARTDPTPPGGAASSGGNGTSPSTDSTAGTAALDDASIGCAGDPRAENFAPNLTHKGDSGLLSFVLVSSAPDGI